MTIIRPSPSLAWKIPGVLGAAGNLNVTAFLAVSVEEASYAANAMISGSE